MSKVEDTICAGQEENLSYDKWGSYFQQQLVFCVINTVQDTWVTEESYSRNTGIIISKLAIFLLIRNINQGLLG